MPPRGLTKGLVEKKNQLEIKESAKIAAYSPRNKRAKSELENSTLKPLTNSLSPSAKSKGARFVSASKASAHIGANGQNIRLAGGPPYTGDRLSNATRQKIKNRNMHTSYLTDWAAERTPPKKE